MAKRKTKKPKGTAVSIHDFGCIKTAGGEFQLTVGEMPLLTYAGDPASHRSEKLIQQIIDEFDGQGRIYIDQNKIVDPHFNLSYIILGIQKRMIDTNLHPESGFAHWLSHDPMLYRCAGPEVVDQIARWEAVFDYLKDLGLSLPSLVANFVDRSEFESDEEFEEDVAESLPDKDFCNRIEVEFNQLLPEEKAVVLHLACVHHGLVLLPMALVTGRCTPNDYARGAMAAHALLIDVFSDVEEEEYRTSFDELRNHVNLALSYLKVCGINGLTQRFVKDQPVALEEDRNYEFKEVRGNDPIGAIKNKADEYVVAFLNSGEGGHILWGIKDDDRTVTGVKLDFSQRDKLRLDIVGKLNEIQPKISPTQYRVTLHPIIDNGQPATDLYVVEIHVPSQASAEPFYTGGNECFVRTDGCKRKLGGPALTDWIRRKLSTSSP